MNVKDTIKARKSTRAFLNKPVEKEKIIRILDAARFAPSGVNTQPWSVAVVSGEKKQYLQDKMEALFRSGEKANMDYSYYPSEWFSPFKERRRECGLLMYSTLGIEREEKQRMLDQWAANYRSFDAPVTLYFFAPKGIEKGSFIDYGMFLQSVMISAIEEGLATCPQAAQAEYPELVKEVLGYDLECLLLCGISLGYEDKHALINSYRTPRESVESFTKFFD